ncbi:hypothetical protein GCM10029976_087940 [Kribbella albertanoniae]|uniref:Peptidase M43 pregnancy-associated plasma-A domain-containing protein n=1 Tax=Kribbella albertanoniae TaxID=1266829 RepID=A0A4R4P4Y4_9ACTN|nr:hypothetical protein [Kribbella albertanoniae]TDC15810.1 hypothetical protein E1261_39990 [Kribbella albertanoniae]
MRRRQLAATAAAVLGLVTGLVTAIPANGAPPQFEHLKPGAQPELAERVPLNVVLLGYKPGSVDLAALNGTLPVNHKPKQITRLLAGIDETVGLDYTYDYRLQYADQTYQNRFFQQLAGFARPVEVNSVQAKYNAQQNNKLDVTASHEIDAPTVEKWLAFNPPSGVDTRENTVYLINWYDRPDFKFHVYTKTDEPDPDTGQNWGKYASRGLVAWGGTTAADEESGLGATRRVWFHDLSAGPDQFSGSWNVDNPDLDGDNQPDYRIPPAWEYAADGYRKPGDLTADLGRLLRTVVVHSLVTASPTYPVELTIAKAATVNLDSNTYEGWAGSDKYLKPELVTAELGEVLPGIDLSFDQQNLPYDGEAKRCVEDWLRDVSCYPETNLPPFANMFLQNKREIDRVLDDQGKVDYELPIFNYAMTQENLPWLGYAGDNWSDGSPGYVYNWLSPQYVGWGYGFTSTMIHEVGHHIGLTHPHDGYDGITGKFFEPTGPYYFAWLGDESNSVMNYLQINTDFGQFDQDNLARFRAAALIEAANALAADVLASPHADRAYADLLRADQLIGQVKARLADHEYDVTRELADQAYAAVAEGARKAGIDVQKFEAEQMAEARAARAAHPTEPLAPRPVTPRKG